MIGRRLICSLAAAALVLLAGGSAGAETILFVGNSFTFGAGSAAIRYRPGSVTDLNGDGIGGVPAIFRRFAEQAGLAYDVAVETGGGRSLGWHLAERRAGIDRAWDHVVLQEYSTLDAARPGDPTRFIADTQALAALFAARNPGVRLRLTATWSRPDLVRAGPVVRGVVPVGQAFICAIRAA